MAETVTPSEEPKDTLKLKVLENFFSLNDKTIHDAYLWLKDHGVSISEKTLNSLLYTEIGTDFWNLNEGKITIKEEFLNDPDGWEEFLAAERRLKRRPNAGANRESNSPSTQRRRSQESTGVYTSTTNGTHSRAVRRD